MTKFFFTILLSLSTLLLHAQVDFDSIEYWVGSGPDSAVFVIDFLDESTDPSYQWGYLFDATGNITAADMMTEISNNEPVLNIDIASGFLNDITYNTHAGIGGSPNFWGTWSLTGVDWTLNNGITETLMNGSVFGCTYTDFAPAVAPTTAISAYSSQWFSADNITFWTGTGANEAVFVVDFIDDLDYGLPVRFAWGYRFDGTATAEEMLLSIGDNDENLNIDMTGGFLNDITYNDLAGIAGDPYYWGTFSGTNLSDWTLNSGIGETLVDGSWFGCTYAEWEPPRPTTPLPATDPSSFDMSDITYWYGTGVDSAVVVIDFNDGGTEESIAFGYLFSGTSTGEEALMSLSDAIADFDVNIASGFLNDITYDGHAGIGGNPNYWGTWSSTNPGGWVLNIGIDTELSSGDWFGCSYTDWSPALPPSLPINPLVGIKGNSQNLLTIYPNPCTNYITIDSPSMLSRIIVKDVLGNIVYSSELSTKSYILNMTPLSAGTYYISTTDEMGVWHKVIKE